MAFGFIQKLSPFLAGVIVYAVMTVPLQAQQQSNLLRKFQQRNKSVPSAFIIQKPVIRFDGGGDGRAEIKGMFYANLTEKKQQAILSLARQSSGLKIRFDAATQIPNFIEAASIGTKRYELNDDKQAMSAAISAMNNIAPLLGIENGEKEFIATSVVRDDLGKTHVRLQQTVGTIPVFGSECIIHFNSTGQPEAWNGQVTPISVTITTKPALSAKEAASVAYLHAGAVSNGEFTSPEQPAALGYTDVEPQLVIYAGVGKAVPPVLAWHITVRPNGLERREYFLDATTGAVILSFNNTCSTGPATGSGKDLSGQNRQFPTFDVNGTFFMIDASRPMFNAAASKMPGDPIGAIITMDSRNKPLKEIFQITSANNSWNDATSVSAHFNAGLTFEYYRATHNRNSLDGKGGTMISAVHVANQDGSSMDNAFWNGKVMAYGDGKQLFSPLAKSLDVAAHEMTHGVTEHSAGLVYLSQSGAINESMSDVFACMVDRDDFQMGEGVTNPAVFVTGFLRDMASPHNGGTSLQDNGWQPEKMSEFQTLPETDDGDNGGVHVNSGIPNHAAFLISSEIGREKTEKIYYRALTQYLTSTSQFIDLRLAVVRAAKELFGAAEEAVAKQAFDRVEIFDGNGNSAPPDDSPVNGPQFLLVQNTNFASTTVTLMIIKPENAGPNDIHPISLTLCNNKPSVSDDGSLAVFVAADKTLHMITLDINNPVETILNASQIWNSIALSRDGKRVAATPAEADGTITVFDLVSQDSKEFILYSPTTSQGQEAGIVLAANTLEWDASSQFVIYDALNALITGAGEEYDYADIGLIRAWDKDANRFGDGLIQRVLPSLGDGENVGNPTFAKTSSVVIGFDYLNTLTNKSAVMGANLFKLELSEIIENPGSIGMPSFSPDDKRLAFVAKENGIEIVKTIPLASDRIKAAGAPVVAKLTSTFPVYFGVGQRPNGVEESATIQNNIECSPNPVTSQVSVQFPAPVAGNYTITITDIFGREVMTMNREVSDVGRQIFGVSTTSLANGMYSVRIAHGNAVSFGRFIVAR